MKSRVGGETANNTIVGEEGEMPSLMAVMPGSSLRSRRDKSMGGAAAAVKGVTPTIRSQVNARKDKKTKLLPVRGEEVLLTSAGNNTEEEEAGASKDASEQPQEVADGIVLFSKERTDEQLELLWTVQPTTSTASLLRIQFRAMLKKRFFFALRDRRMQFFQIVCPVLCILLAMLLQLVQDDATFNMEYTSSFYKQPHLLDSGGCDAFYGDLSADSGSYPYHSYAFAQKPSKKGTTYDSGLYDLLLHNSSSELTAAMQDNYLYSTYRTHTQPRYGSVYCADAFLTAQVQLVSSKAISGSQMVYHYGYNTSSLHSLPQTMASHHYLVYLGGLKAAGRLNDTSATFSDSSTDKSAIFRLKLTSLPKASSTSSTASSSSTASILISVIVLIPFTFLPANPVAWVVRETEIQARHQQRISGLRYAVYWFSNFCFDYIAYLISLLLVFIIFLIFQRDEFIGRDNVGAALIAFLLYGLCFCWAAYAVSFAFTEHTIAQMVVLGTSFLSGFILVLLVFVLNLMESTQDAAKIMRWVFRPVPSYAIGEVILNLAFLASNQLTDTSLTAWSMSVTGYPMIFLAGEAIVFFVFTMVVDHPGLQGLRQALRNCCCCCCDAVRQRKVKKHLLTLQEAAPPQQQELLLGEENVNDEGDEMDEREGNGSTIVVETSGRRRGSKSGGPPQPLTPADLARSSNADSNEVTLTSSMHNSSVRGRRQLGVAHGPFATGSTPTASEVTQVVVVEGSPAPYGDTPVAENGQQLLSTKPTQQGVTRVMSDDLESPAFLASITQVSNPQASITHRAENLAVTFQLPTVLAPLGGAANNNNNHNNNYNNASMLTGVEGENAPIDRLVLNQTGIIRCRETPVYPPKLLQKTDAELLVEDIDVMDERAAVYADERRHLDWKRQRGHRRNVVDPAGHDVVRVVDLRKVYSKKHRVAVRGLNFGVMPREVFGFLGTNGAGKTTALSILTQRQPATSGRAYVCGHDVERDSAKAQQKIGYCPQFDTCYDLLTVQEHVDLYAAIRGLRRAERARVVPPLLELMGLRLYKDVLSKDLSGGNRRKLSVAMSLLGMPEVVCLDEPSAGMDPLARRMMWRVLERVSRQCAIVLTTHHLEEVEALADTVAILAHGSLRCIGDLTHLKHKFANNAYELIIRVKPGARGRYYKQLQQQQQQQKRGSTEKEGMEPVVGERTDGRGSVSSNPLDDAADGSDITKQKQQAQLNSSSTRRKQKMAAPCTASITYDGVEMIDLNTDIVLFMQTNFPAALLLENFCDERYVYSLPTSDSMATQMQQLQASQVSHTSTAAAAAAGTPSRTPYKHKKNGFSTAEVLALLQANKEALHIAEYSLSLVSLEQVFLRVTAEEDNMVEGEAAQLAKERRVSVTASAGVGMQNSILFSPNATAAAQRYASPSAPAHELLFGRSAGGGGGANQLEQSLHAANLSLVRRSSLAAASMRPDMVMRRASLPPTEPGSPFAPPTALRRGAGDDMLSLSRVDPDGDAFLRSTSSYVHAHNSSIMESGSRHRRRVAARPVGEPSSPLPTSPALATGARRTSKVVLPPSPTEEPLTTTTTTEKKTTNNNNNNNNKNKNSDIYANYTHAQLRRMKAK